MGGGQRGDGGGPTGRALLVASVVHALGLLGIQQLATRFVDPPAPPPAATEAIEPFEVELDHDPVAAVAAERPLGATAGTAVEVSPPVAASRPAPALERIVEVPAVEVAPPVPAGEPGEDPGWSARPAGGDLPLPSLGGEPLWLSLGGLETVAPPAPTRAPSPPIDRRAATRAISGTMQARDRELGLDIPAAGAVASALATSVRGTPAPHGARATFEVRLGADGNLLSARWMSASKGDPRDWESAVAEAKKALVGRALPMGDAGALRGALIRVHVTTVHQLPSGVHHAEIHAQCANALLNDLIIANKRTDDADSNEAAPDVTIFTDERGNPCIPIGLGMVFDPADLGAHRVLQVRTSVEVVIPGVAALPADTPDVDTSAPWGGQPAKGPRPTQPFVERKWKKKRERVDGE